MHKTPRIAIVSDNTLMVVGLRNIIEAMMPTVDVDTHTTVAQLHQAEDQETHYFHYFVTARVLLTDIAFFTRHHDKCIVLTDNSMTLLPADFHTLDMSQDEHQLVRQLMLLQHRGHQGRDVPASAHPHPTPQGNSPKHIHHQAQIRQWMQAQATHHPHMALQQAPQTKQHTHTSPTPTNKDAHNVPPSSLSYREREVLILMVKGNINKEIAAKLNIGLTTVISHRRNLIQKLGIRSISAITIYAVTHGLLSVEAIETKD